MPSARSSRPSLPSVRSSAPRGLPRVPRGWLFDMDGVLYQGHRPNRGAIRFLRKVQERGAPYLLLTNHGCLTPAGFSKKLAKMGIRVPPSRIYSSSEATAEWLAARKVRRVFAIGEEGLFRALRLHGIRRARTRVRHVVVSLDRAINYEKLSAACWLLTHGAAFIGSNPDPCYPVEHGQVPECGAILAALEVSTGRKPTIIGKPSPAIFRQAARRLGVPVRNLTMIGDRLDTDILGAKRAGARGVLVLTGHTTRRMLRRSTVRPDRVVNDLAELEL